MIEFTGKIRLDLFCFQEINDKMRHAQDRFRSWCSSREKDLEQLEINWEIESWLEKDLIFHLYDFKLKIQKAKGRKDIGISEALKIESENACEDYYDYIYKGLKFKSEHKRVAIYLLVLVLLPNIVEGFGFPLSKIFSYIIVLTITGVIFGMLRGPKFNFTYHPFTNRKAELSAEENKKIKELEDLIRGI